MTWGGGESESGRPCVLLIVPSKVWSRGEPREARRGARPSHSRFHFPLLGCSGSALCQPNV